MTQPAETTPSLDPLICAEQACARIAPSWPLDRWIAVNPAWKMVDQPLAEVADRLQQLADIRLLPDRSHWLEAWKTQRVLSEDLHAAARDMHQQTDIDTLLHHLSSDACGKRLPLITHVADAQRPLEREMAWQLEVVHQISQCCAAYFSHDHQGWRPTTRNGLFACWHGLAGVDRGIGLLMNTPGIHRHFAELPDSAERSIENDLIRLGLPASQWTDYCHALLLSIHGWASCCAHQGWEAQLAGGSDRHLTELLAIRLAWDRILFEQVLDDQRRMEWTRAWSETPAPASDRTLDWIWQRATERAYQRRLLATLDQPATASTASPGLQAMFCIDVRSEPIRRALEAQSPEIETFGFAGFFGLPISYQAGASTHQSPRLPGLLAPQLLACEPDSPRDANTVLARRQRGVLTQATRVGPAMFQLVETLGLGYAAKLLSRRRGSQRDQLRNPLSGPLHLCHHDGSDLLAEQRVELAQGLISGAGLGPDFAPWVLICGHEAHSSNNPQDAGLQCGACGGHGGAVNARAAAQLLNDPAVRDGLKQRGVEIPDETRFLAAVHDTTRQRLRLLVEGALPSDIQQWLDQASASLREMLAGQFPDPTGNDGSALGLIERSNDWAQTRPEWGLANNAALLVAPRKRSRGLNLEGRCFLHDYQPDSDADASVLRQIMTAPMVVAHWINFQYYASVCDPYRLGSGNKVLHNVVGGHVGVFEGNGGDLRIGLAMQSVHDGTHWRHEPLRLSVLIDAPAERIERILNEEPVVRQLVDNSWLHLLCIHGERPHRYHNGQWVAADA